MSSLPAQIGPYRVLRQIGKGGMGMVLEAVQTTIERRVAIKLLLPEYAKDAAVAERLFREALAVNRIEHPSLVQVSDYGKLPDGQVYLVMEFLRGQTLASWMDQNPGAVPVAMAVKVAAQVASALAAAHAKGVVHRDLKPDNLMLVEDAAEPGAVRVKVLDFGIAKVVQEQAPSKAKTATDLVMGTPFYMSPEQCQGAGYVDAKSDVYSLGVMLFEMLSGRLPFDGEGSGQIIGMHLFKSPPLLCEVAPSVPAGLADLVQGLLAKSRDARPTMEELRVEFERMVRAGSAEPSAGILARLDLPSESAEKPRHRRAATTLGGSNGQSQLKGRRPSRRWLMAGGTLGMLLVGLAATLALRAPSRNPEPKPSPKAQVNPGPEFHDKAMPTQASSPPSAPASGRVRWSITSQPSGAEIIRTADGELLGKTPWEGIPSAGSGALKVQVRLNGFETEPLTLDNGLGIKIGLTLRRKAGQPVGVRSKPPAPTAPARSKKTEPVRSIALED